MISDINKTFAKNMRTRRKQLHLSQEKLGELSGLHRTYIGGIEQFSRNPSLASMQKIADALKCDISILTSEYFEDITSNEFSICYFNEKEYKFLPLSSDEIDDEILDAIKTIKEDKFFKL